MSAPVSVGGLQLRSNLLLLGLRTDPVAVDVQRSEGGVAHILVGEMEGGRYLSLEGWFTSAQVDTLMDMARLGQPVELIHPRGTFSVLVIGSSLEDLFESVESDPNDIEFGKVNLIEV